jgi:hypothetical protein
MTEQTPAPGQADTVPGGQEKAGGTPQAASTAPEQAKSLLGGGGQAAQEPAAEPENTGDGGQDKAKQPEEGIPEKYEFQLPDGMQPDEALIAEFTPLAKELKLTTTQAQKFADMYSKKVSEMSARQTEAAMRFIEQDSAAVKADPQYGGEKLAENMASAERFLKTVDPEGKFVKHLNERQFISLNDPELIRVFIAAGKMLAEDQTPGGRATFGQKSPAEVLYPSMGK